MTLDPRRATLDDLIRDLRHLEARAASDLADWLVHLDLEGKRERTIYAYHRQLAALLRAWPDLELAEITHTHVNEVLHHIPARSRHITRSILNKFFEWAEADERIARSPMHRVPKMRQPKGRPPDIFSEAEQELLEALPSPDGELWTLLFGSGLRRGEARRLRLGHVSLARGRLVVYDGKGGKDRVVPVSTVVLAAVDKLATFEGIADFPEAHVWYKLTGSHGRRIHPTTDPIGDTTFENWYRRGIAAADVRYLNPHQTRHTYGFRLKDAGFDLEERSLLMGHESPTTTKRYYPALSIEDVARKVGRL